MKYFEKDINVQADRSHFLFSALGGSKQFSTASLQTPKMYFGTKRKMAVKRTVRGVRGVALSQLDCYSLCKICPFLLL